MSRRTQTAFMKHVVEDLMKESIIFVGDPAKPKASVVPFFHEICGGLRHQVGRKHQNFYKIGKLEKGDVKWQTRWQRKRKTKNKVKPTL